MTKGAMTINDIRKKYPDYSIPELDFHPIFSSVVIWRLPEKDKTAGGLFIPETSKQPLSRGVLLAAGLKALDELKSHGAALGDVVVFAKYAGVDMAVREKSGDVPDEILVCKAGDVLASKGFQERLVAGEVKISCIEGEHFIAVDSTRTKRHDPLRSK